ncbi:MAG: helix-turn-helix transcriptional regulator [Sphingomonadaceae bacterium]
MPYQLSPRQSEILRLISMRYAIKEIASLLEVSESAINKQISNLKQKTGAASLGELASVYHALTAASSEFEATETECRKPSSSFSHLSSGLSRLEKSTQDESESFVAFSDAQAWQSEAPWIAKPEPRVVPRWLDGQNAGIMRMISMFGVAFMLIAGVILSVGAMQAISEISAVEAEP